MTASVNDRRITRRSFVRDMGNGVTLTAEVSPCVFMYAGYPLQLTITLHRHGERLGDAHAADRAKTAQTYSAADVERLLGKVRTAPCPRCSSPAFDPASVETNRRGLCEACFRNDLETEFAASAEAERQEVAALDRSMKRKGMAVRVSAWVHPDFGDDYPVDWYFPDRPSRARIRRLLREEGSSQPDDYDIVIL